MMSFHLLVNFFSRSPGSTNDPNLIRTPIATTPTATSIPPLVTLASNVLPSPTNMHQTSRFSIRADVSYDTNHKVLTAALELPGVRRQDVNITLGTCLYNGVRQICISGRTVPASSMLGNIRPVRERKFGEYSRIFAVPMDTKVRFLVLSLFTYLEFTTEGHTRRFSLSFSHTLFFFLYLASVDRLIETNISA